MNASGTVTLCQLDVPEVSVALSVATILQFSCVCSSSPFLCALARMRAGVTFGSVRGCLLVAAWWAVRWPRDLPRLLNNKRLFRHSQGDSMKGAATERKGRGEGGWREDSGGGGDSGGDGGCEGRDMAGFVGGEGLIIFQLSLSFLCRFCFVFASSKSVSLSTSLSLPLSPDLSLSLSQPVCCQLQLHFLLGSYLFHPPTPLSLFSFHFLIPLFALYPPLPPFPASFHLIYLLLATSHASFLESLPLSPPLSFFFLLLSIMCISLFPPPQLHPLSH